MKLISSSELMASEWLPLTVYAFPTLEDFNHKTEDILYCPPSSPGTSHFLKPD
jgi:hypothetical protein